MSNIGSAPLRESIPPKNSSAATELINEIRIELASGGEDSVICICTRSSALRNGSASNEGKVPLVATLTTTNAAAAVEHPGSNDATGEVKTLRVQLNPQTTWTTLQLPPHGTLAITSATTMPIESSDQAKSAVPVASAAIEKATPTSNSVSRTKLEALVSLALIALGFTAVATSIWLETYDNTALLETMWDQSVRLQSVGKWLVFWLVCARLLFLRWQWLTHLRVTALGVCFYGLVKLLLPYFSALLGVEPPPYTAFLGLMVVIFACACFHCYAMPVTRLQFQGLVAATLVATCLYGVSTKHRADWERSAIGDIPQQLPTGWDFREHETPVELARQLKNLRERADAALSEPAKP
jgi:hypothetical protein